MLQVIREDIHERVAHRARASQVAPVIPVAPHLAARATEHSLVHAHRDPHGEAAHAVRERRGVFGFDDEMDVVRLNRVVRDAEAAAVRVAHRLLQHAMDTVAAQAR
jgi:hypothetical protein